MLLDKIYRMTVLQKYKRIGLTVNVNKTKSMRYCSGQWRVNCVNQRLNIVLDGYSVE